MSHGLNAALNTLPPSVCVCVCVCVFLPGPGATQSSSSLPGWHDIRCSARWGLIVPQEGICLHPVGPPHIFTWIMLTHQYKSGASGSYTELFRLIGLHTYAIALCILTGNLSAVIKQAEQKRSSSDRLNDGQTHIYWYWSARTLTPLILMGILWFWYSRGRHWTHTTHPNTVANQGVLGRVPPQQDSVPEQWLEDWDKELRAVTRPLKCPAPSTVQHPWDKKPDPCRSHHAAYRTQSICCQCTGARNHRTAQMPRRVGAKFVPPPGLHGSDSSSDVSWMLDWTGIHWGQADTLNSSLSSVHSWGGLALPPGRSLGLQWCLGGWCMSKESF